MTGYTSSMNHQTKTLVDAAEDAGVSFLVHLGVFGNGRSTDPHFAWHELVERYIAGSKLAWANVHAAAALLRTEAGQDPYNRELSDLIGELSTQSEAFRAL